MQLEEINPQSVVTVNRRLNPRLWHNDQLDAQVRSKLMDIARAFEEFIGIDLTVKDYTITGSNANYTWTRHSDLDLHLVIPGEPSQRDRELYSAKKALWSQQHDIRIKGLPVECYVQGAAEPHHSTGVYSLNKNNWIVRPKKVRPRIDDAAVRAKSDSLAHDARMALASNDLEKITVIKDKITKMRQAGLDRAGEWSVENLAFKTLRNLGLIDQLAERIRELEDQTLSLEHFSVWL
jgi:hypothetical protein